MNNKIKCSICDKFVSKNSESKHRIRVHGKKCESKKQIQCQETDCSQKYENLHALRIHLKDSHGFQNQDEHEERVFYCLEDFRQWLAEEEANTKTKFVISCSGRKRSSHIYRVFDCNRSGSSKTKAVERKRQLKTQGSVKVGHHCTSRIIVKDFKSQIKVTYYKRHYKHDRELCHLPLPETEKHLIVGKLLNGVSEHDIIHDMRSSLDENDIQRKHFITKKDLQNIKKKFGIPSSNKTHEVRDSENTGHSLTSTFVNQHVFSNKSCEVQDSVNTGDNSTTFVNQHDSSNKSHDARDSINTDHGSTITFVNQHDVNKKSLLLICSRLNSISSMDNKKAKQIKSYINAIEDILSTVA